MEAITLQTITRHNWKECSQLAVEESQVAFVPSNLYSIAEAQFYPQARALGIYNQANQMVGFAMYGRDEASNQWKVFRLMVDAAHQKRGYGRAALQQVIAEIARQPDGQQIIICYQTANEPARRLYAQLGFVEQSMDATGKVTALLRIP